MYLPQVFYGRKLLILKGRTFPIKHKYLYENIIKTNLLSSFFLRYLPTFP